MTVSRKRPSGCSALLVAGSAAQLAGSRRLLQGTCLGGSFHRWRDSFLPRSGLTSAAVAMRYISGMGVPAFTKSAPLCHRKGALAMSDGSSPAPVPVPRNGQAGPKRGKSFECLHQVVLLFLLS